MAAFVHGIPASLPECRCTLMMIPDSNPIASKAVDSHRVRRLQFCSHSRLGSRKPARGGSLCFSLYACIRYIMPATNPSATEMVPASNEKPCIADHVVVFVLSKPVVSSAAMAIRIKARITGKKNTPKAFSKTFA